MSTWADWIGRKEESFDRLSTATVARLYATLDRESSDPAGFAPALAHWLCFLPAAPQSRIDRDGHPKRGGFLPPIDLPRRMWAGGRLVFHARLPMDTPLVRQSTILKVAEKTGASGHLVFVTIQHTVSAEGAVVVVEEQDLVYREDPVRGAGPPPPVADAIVERGDAELLVIPDPVLLFRFSALTFNAHRIHYDRDYARDVEGYAGLVVHGPLLATMLMHHWLAQNPQLQPQRFSFRAQRPLLDDAPFSLCLKPGNDSTRLWTRDHLGQVTMRADVA